MTRAGALSGFMNHIGHNLFSWSLILSLHSPDLIFKELLDKIFYNKASLNIDSNSTEQAQGLNKNVPAEQSHSHQAVVIQGGRREVPNRVLSGPSQLFLSDKASYTLSPDRRKAQYSESFKMGV